MYLLRYLRSIIILKLFYLWVYWQLFFFMELVFCEQLLFKSGFNNNFTNFVFMCVTDKEEITN
jgi:hypothetical protein